MCKTTESYLKSHDEKKMSGCCKHWQTNRHNAIVLLFVCGILTKIHTFFFYNRTKLVRSSTSVNEFCVLQLVFKWIECVELLEYIYSYILFQFSNWQTYLPLTSACDMHFLFLTCKTNTNAWCTAHWYSCRVHIVQSVHLKVWNLWQMSWL